MLGNFHSAGFMNPCPLFRGLVTLILFGTGVMPYGQVKETRLVDNLLESMCHTF